MTPASYNKHTGIPLKEDKDLNCITLFHWIIKLSFVSSAPSMAHSRGQFRAWQTRYKPLDWASHRNRKKSHSNQSCLLTHIFSLKKWWFHVKNLRKNDQFFFDFWLEKSKVIIILGIKISFLTFFLVILDLFIKFCRKSQILLICWSEILKTMFYYFF